MDRSGGTISMTGREIGSERAVYRMIVRNGSEVLDDSTLFCEPWAARHNQEIWGTEPSGVYVYEVVTPPSVCASAMR